MSVASALLLTAVVALLALALGAAVGAVLVPRLRDRRERRTADQAGITISEMLQHVV
ncbi:MAG: two-component sensor histidine kinase, partial [Mycobacterium sp.]|nr:two-component sensor histidine kinase [Mycobacterium sp.]